MNTKLCKDCKHSAYNSKNGHLTIHFSSTVACRRVPGKEKLCLVDGHTNMVYPLRCLEEREPSILSEGKDVCGPEGKYFEPVTKNA